MSYVAILAAGGASSRTGLGEYTTKAALRVGDRTLLEHQLKFFRDSGVEHVFILARPEHLRVLTARLSPLDQSFTAFLPVGKPSGWAGEV